MNWVEIKAKSADEIILIYRCFYGHEISNEIFKEIRLIHIDQKNCKECDKD